MTGLCHMRHEIRTFACDQPDESIIFSTHTAGIHDIRIWELSCHPDHFVSDYQEWLCNGFGFMIQMGPDLGHKMRDAFEQSLTLGFDRVILTGSDLLHLPGAVIETAAQKTGA
jgi:hypothetical protein